MELKKRLILAHVTRWRARIDQRTKRNRSEAAKAGPAPSLSRINKHTLTDAFHGSEYLLLILHDNDHTLDVQIIYSAGYDAEATEATDPDQCLCCYTYGQQ